MLIDAAKCQDYNLYHFWVIKEKPTGGGRVGGGRKICGNFCKICTDKKKWLMKWKNCLKKVNIDITNGCFWKSKGKDLLYTLSFEH